MLKGIGFEREVAAVMEGGEVVGRIGDVMRGRSRRRRRRRRERLRDVGIGRRNVIRMSCGGDLGRSGLWDVL